MFVHLFTISPYDYCQLGKANIFPELYGCRYPGCLFKGRLRKHGFYNRWAITLDGVHLVWIQRYLCPHCGHTTSVLPAFLAPHFQFTLRVLVRVLEGLHQLGLSTQAMVKQWHSPSVNLNRQSIQYMRRRLKKKANLYTQFLGGDQTDVKSVEQLLLTRLQQYGDIEHLAQAFFMSWSQPFLSHS